MSIPTLYIIIDYCFRMFLIFRPKKRGERNIKSKKKREKLLDRASEKSMGSKNRQMMTTTMRTKMTRMTSLEVPRKEKKTKTL